METVKRLFISLIVLLGCSAGAWAIEQDSDGYYLIGSVQDWQDFAELVNGGTTNINARMIADINLGDDQTHIGSMTQDRTAYSGIFDGQGYTLTVAYVGSSKQIVAPFTQVIGATIKNLHVDGSIQSAFAFVGVVGYVRGGASSYISNIWMSANASCNSGEWHHTGSIVGSVAGGSAAYVTNCLFTGTLTSGSSYSSTFIGCNYGGGIASSTNCLSTGTLNISGSVSLGTSNNCYVKQFPRTIPEEMQVTDEQLADGTIAARLGDAWVQDAVTRQPMLKIFTTMRQDEDGYYLIGSVTDWRRFAAIVKTTSTANAKMIRDVDLGDDQTKIGDDIAYTNPSTPNASNPYKGTFDGQGHTLTVNYTTETGKFPSPFPNIEGATIKNLHVAGSIVSTTAHAGGVVSASWGTDVIENVWVSATISSTGQSWDECGAIVACMKKGTLTLKDCIFTGSMTSTRSYNGCFVGYCNAGTTAIDNCLSTGTFSYGGANITYGNITHTNCFVKQFSASIPATMQVTDEQIADGTTTIALQAGRADEIWVQDPELGIPMLKIFATPAVDYFLIGSLQDWKDFAELVETEPTTNGKLIADVDLGDDQTMVGSLAAPYQGIFDGQGYTLTVNYDMNLTTSAVAPFNVVGDAVIQKLHVAGSIKQQYCGAGGVVGSIMGNVTIKECWVSAYMYVQGYGNLQGTIGGIASCCDNSAASNCSILIEDCVFSGEMGTGYHCGSIMSHVNSGYGNSAVIKNCLAIGTYVSHQGTTGTFIRVGVQGDPYTIDNCYYKTPWGAVQGTQATETELSDGTTAAALGDAWAQDPGTGNPLPKVFTTMRQDEDGYYLIGSVTDWKRFADIVKTTPNANAKMTADVDLGDDQTMIGTSSMKYQGTFDGQAHTLTVNYFGSSKQFIAPLHYVDGGTILNLRIDGIVSSSSEHLSGLIGKAYNEITIENCLVAAEIKMNSDYAGGFVGNGGSQMYNDPSKVVFKNCLFAGTFTGVGGSRNTAAGFYGWGKSTPVFINCLENGTYNNVSGYNPYMYEGTDKDNTETTANSYYKHGNINLEGISDASAMTDGEIVSNLGDAWVIDGILNMPMLKIFANTEEVPFTDLSAKETANCYIVQAAGNYKFRATVKGNGSADLGGISRYTDASTIASAELVWATFNTTVTPEADELIKDIRYSNGYVYFSTGDIYKEGNALVAIKDAGGNILWSWHLWFESDDLDALVQTYPGSGYLVMDRNLGALTNCYAADNALDFGFAYQNGRKDPFMMSATRTRYTALGVLGTYTSSAGSSSLASSIQRPTVVFGTDSWGGSPDYWSASEKTIFDPCPPGWQVGPSDLWRASGFNSSTFVVKENDWATYHGCVFNGEAWYPATGDRWGGSHNNTGSLIRVWARGAGNALASNNGSAPTLGDGSNPGHGYSIRPVRIADFIYTVPVSGLGTFSADVNIIVPKGLTAYYCTTLKTYKDGSLGIKVSKLNGGIIPANTGVLFEGTGGQSYPLISTNVEAAASAENSLVAVVESEHIAATEGDYTNFMMKGGKFIKIADDNASMPANRAYLPLLTSAISGSNAKEIMLYWDDEEVR